MINDIETQFKLLKMEKKREVPTSASPLVAILPGDAGFSQLFLGILFAAFVALMIGGIGITLWSFKHPSDAHGPRHGIGKYETPWVIIVTIILFSVATSTLGLLPYPYAHANVSPNVVVNVQAIQFQWCLAPSPNWGTNCQAEMIIPHGSIVLFNVTSLDVNHGFGVYTAQGSLLFQVQVMPGYYNNVMYQFSQSGLYSVRCLEFCGYGHFGMVSQLNVT